MRRTKTKTNENQKRDAIGDAEDAEVGDEQTLPARREVFVASARATPVPKRAAASPFGRKAGAGAVAPAPRLAPADARGISGTPATLAARAGGRWAPPPRVRGELGAGEDQKVGGGEPPPLAAVVGSARGGRGDGRQRRAPRRRLACGESAGREVERVASRAGVSVRGDDAFGRRRRSSARDAARDAIVVAAGGRVTLLFFVRAVMSSVVRRATRFARLARLRIATRVTCGVIFVTLLEASESSRS
jgi:hypothetical protein